MIDVEYNENFNCSSLSQYSKIEINSDCYKSPKNIEIKNDSNENVNENVNENENENEKVKKNNLLLFIFK